MKEKRDSAAKEMVSIPKYGIKIVIPLKKYPVSSINQHYLRIATDSNR